MRKMDRLVSFAFIIAVIGLSTCSRDIAKSWNNKGGALHSMGRHSEAIECFRRAEELGHTEAGQMLERLEKEGH